MGKAAPHGPGGGGRGDEEGRDREFTGWFFVAIRGEVEVGGAEDEAAAGE